MIVDITRKVPPGDKFYEWYAKVNETNRRWPRETTGGESDAEQLGH